MSRGPATGKIGSEPHVGGSPLPTSAVLMAVLALLVWLTWPLMGRPVLAGG